MNDGATRSRIRLRHLLPLFGFIVPTIIGSIIMWPPEAMKTHLIGSFILMLVSVVGTYLFGIYLALEDRRRMDCEFCSVTAFNGRRYRRRPSDEVLAELESIPQKMIFFVDDNLIGYGHESREAILTLSGGRQTPETPPPRRLGGVRHDERHPPADGR